MLLLVVALVAGASGAQSAAGVDDFERSFRDETLRIDYYRGGTHRTSTLSLARMLVEKVWAGPRQHLVDAVDYGPYRVSVIRRADERLLYRAGFSSVFWESRTVPEAKTSHRVFPESVSVPMPKQPVEIVLEERDRRGVFHESSRWPVDPEDIDLHREGRRRDLDVVKLIDNGPTAEKLDLAIIAEGYTKAEIPQFRSDAKKLIESVFRREPLRSHRHAFNVHLVCAPSAGSGIDDPKAKRFPRTAAECTFRGLGIDRYILALDYHRVRDLASAAPHDLIAVLVNSDRYGGGGIYRWFLTCTARNEASAFVFLHEFGHLCAGLADEYYASSVTYEDLFPTDVEPWEANITRATVRERLKWRALVKEKTPVPTPWQKERYDMIRGGRKKAAFLKKEPAFGQTGAFEGAGYAPTGLYRPSLSCIMFASTAKRYCAVCRDALAREIDRHGR